MTNQVAPNMPNKAKISAAIRGDPFDFCVLVLITTLIRAGISEGAIIVRDLINNKPNITHEEILRELRDKITISESLVAVVTRGNNEIDCYTN